jgi:hypothetical protein
MGHAPARAPMSGAGVSPPHTHHARAPHCMQRSFARTPTHRIPLSLGMAHAAAAAALQRPRQRRAARGGWQGKAPASRPRRGAMPKPYAYIPVIETHTRSCRRRARGQGAPERRRGGLAALPWRAGRRPRGCQRRGAHVPRRVHAQRTQPASPRSRRAHIASLNPPTSLSPQTRPTQRRPTPICRENAPRTAPHAAAGGVWVSPAPQESIGAARRAVGPPRRPFPPRSRRFAASRRAARRAALCAALRCRRCMLLWIVLSAAVVMLNK